MADQKRFLVLSALGTDRPGIVAEVTAFLDERGANVEDSRMAVLGGEFALMMLVSGTAAVMTAVEQSIAQLEERAGLHVHLRPTRAPYQHRASGSVPYVVSAYAMDHEGIIHAIASALSQLGANIVSLETATYPAPVSGTPLFRLEMRLDVPHQVPVSRLREALERVADAENADVDLRPE
ncbi:MAG: transcriptional regulator [Armatimonadetes bacterium]|jgi:glycine cleavage system transcriptional repressor|nr:transcriptional regulator [Armatimonadota bacterium]